MNFLDYPQHIMFCRIWLGAYMHPCSTPIPRSFWHDNEIYARATWVISDCHIEMLMARKYVVDLSIPRGLDIYRGQTSRRITTRNHSLFDWKTKPKTNHFDIWSINHLVILDKSIWRHPTIGVFVLLIVKWSF